MEMFVEHQAIKALISMYVASGLSTLGSQTVGEKNSAAN